MGDNKQLLLLGNLSPGDDHVFLERYLTIKFIKNLKIIYILIESKLV